MLLFFIALLLSSTSVLAQEAICIVPVADMCLHPIQENNLALNAQEAYEGMPISWGRKPEDQAICPRGHQLLFNEKVTILEENGEEALVELHNILYEKPTDVYSRTSYWILKSNLLSLDTLPRSIHEFFPESLSRSMQDISYSDVVCLKAPFFDITTKKTYSAGTRFVIGQKVDSIFVVYVYDTLLKRMVITQIPQSYCFISRGQSPEEKIADFVELLRSWTRTGTIPLVWGGSSFTHYAADSQFSEKQKTLSSGTTLGYWDRSAEIIRPFAGFDASGLIYRAAQICEMPFYYRNTFTAAKYLRPLKHNEAISEGDLVKVIGGMFIVSSIKENKLITALAYSAQYGCVIELDLNKFFVGINSYHDLVHAYQEGKKLNTLRADGTVWNTAMPFTILKMASIWEK